MKDYQVYFREQSERGMESFISKIFKAETEKQAEELFLKESGKEKECIQKIKMISVSWFSCSYTDGTDMCATFLPLLTSGQYEFQCLGVWRKMCMACQQTAGNYSGKLADIYISHQVFLQYGFRLMAWLAPDFK